jgi:SSS family solute:Na+ symporter
MYLSPIAFSFFACGLLSAIMSTADSYLLAGSSLVTKNIILKIWPFTTERAKIYLIRLVNVALSLIALALAFSGHTIFDMMVHSGAVLLVSIFIPTTLALYSKNLDQRLGWISMISGAISWLGFLLCTHYFFHLKINYEDHLFAAAAFGGIVSLASAFFFIAFQYFFYKKQQRSIS